MIIRAEQKAFVNEFVSNSTEKVNVSDKSPRSNESERVRRLTLPVRVEDGEKKRIIRV